MKARFPPHCSQHANDDRVRRAAQQTIPVEFSSISNFVLVSCPAEPQVPKPADMVQVLSSNFLEDEDSMTLPAPIPLDKAKKAKKGVLRFSDVGDDSSEEVYKSGSETRAAPVPLDKPKKAKKGVLRFSDAGDDSEEGCKSGSKTRAAPGHRFSVENLSKTAESISTGFFRKPQAIKRRVKSYSENVASLRAAVVVMFPPKRRKILRSMRDFVQARQLSKITR